MKIIESVFELATKVHEEVNLVTIDYNRLHAVAEEMLRNPLKSKQVDEEEIDAKLSNKNRIILEELVADAVNYCYWTCNSNIRMNDAGSTKMRELLTRHFNSYISLTNENDFENQLRNFHRSMMLHRFPLMDKRREHLMALTRKPIIFGATNRFGYQSNVSVGRTFVDIMTNDSITFEYKFLNLIIEIDGFGDDPFLKRAILFFLQMNRIFGWFEEELRNFPIPADYQIPKMLWAEGIIEFDDDLDEKVLNGEHLRENSPEEMSIRAAAILACDELGAILDWSSSDVDGWFFSRRREYYQTPFHLCITSNY